MRSPVLDTSRELRVVVGVGDWIAATGTQSNLVTYALGSCIGVTAWDPVAKAGGLLHFMLPDSALNPDKARLKPGMFCDTGLAILLEELEKRGAKRHRLRIILAGGAKASGGGDFFDIGRRNLLAAKRKLWEAGLAVEDEECGGEISRTLRLKLGEGRVSVRDSFGERELGRKF